MVFILTAGITVVETDFVSAAFVDAAVTVAVYVLISVPLTVSVVDTVSPGEMARLLVPRVPSVFESV